MTTEVETQEIENQTAPEAPAIEGNTETVGESQSAPVEASQDSSTSASEEVATEYPTPEEAN